MNDELNGQIRRISAAFETWWGTPVNPPAGPAARASAATWFAAHHPGEIPEQLLEFWAVTNGLGLDGYTLWGAEPCNGVSGIIVVNDMYVENFSDYFFLGDSDDIWMYAYHPGLRKFRILAQFEFDHVEAEYDTFDELASAVLAQAIDRADVP